MKYCSRCGRAAFDDTIFCPQCSSTYFHSENNPFHNNYTNNCYEAPLELSHRVLSVAIPLYGFAYWFFKRAESPAKANTARNLALVSIGIDIVLAFLTLFL